MIVCLCRALSERSIRLAAAGRTLEEAVAATGAGSDCGCCAEEVARIAAESGPWPCRAEPCGDCPRRGDDAAAARAA